MATLAFSLDAPLYKSGVDSQSQEKFFVQNITWDDGADILTESDYSAIIAKVDPGLNTAKRLGQREYTQLYWSLKARHFIYSHSSYGMPQFHNGVTLSLGDCQGGAANINTSGLQTASEIGKGLAVAAAYDPEPISKAILGIALSIDKLFTFIFGHHAQAVALEQKDICIATVNVNNLLDAIDNAFYRGQIPQAQAIQNLENMQSALHIGVAPVEKSGAHGSSSCNEACVIETIYQGLLLERMNYLYPQHTSGLLGGLLPTPISNVLSEFGTGVSSVIGSVSGGSIKISANAGILLLIFLIFLGVGIKRMRRAT
jgi:hypothetical protein